MNRILATIILMLSITSILPAQDVQESTQKKVTIGVDVLPLIGGFANAQFGFLHNNGKSEGIFKGIFLEAGFGVGFINWDYGKEEVAAITFWPGINLGYKWSSKFGLSLSPYAGINYGIGELKAIDGTIKIDKDGNEFGGILPSLGLQISSSF